MMAPPLGMADKQGDGGGSARGEGRTHSVAVDGGEGVAAYELEVDGSLAADPSTAPGRYRRTTHSRSTAPHPERGTPSTVRPATSWSRATSLRACTPPTLSAERKGKTGSVKTLEE